MRLLVSFFIFFLLITSCASHYQHLEQSATADTLQFSELPNEVAEKFQWSSMAMTYVPCLVTDSTTITVNDFFVVSRDATRHQSWNYGYYFRINGKKMYINWNPRKDTPFVVDANNIYWCTELNAHRRFEAVKFCRIRWN